MTGTENVDKEMFIPTLCEKLFVNKKLPRRYCKTLEYIQLKRL